jgi:hypothetical protein
MFVMLCLTLHIATPELTVVPEVTDEQSADRKVVAWARGKVGYMICEIHVKCLLSVDAHFI